MVLCHEDPHNVSPNNGSSGASRTISRLVGVNVDVTAAELADLIQFKRLLGSRTEIGCKRRQPDAVTIDCQLPQDWPVLLFVTSVEHAGAHSRTAVLAGVMARSISPRRQRCASLLH